MNETNEQRWTDFGSAVAMRVLIALFAVAGLAFSAGCGGGGGGAVTSVQSGPSSTGADTTSSTARTGYSLINTATGKLGPQQSTINGNGASLTASLPASTDVTISERFYTSGRPTGVIGKIHDIRPDGMSFPSGARLCLDVPSGDYSVGDLTIVTGEMLTQELASAPDGSNKICATLQHASPYSLRRVMNLEKPDYSIFGKLDAKDLYQYKVKTWAEDDPVRGSLQVTRITVYCELKCMTGGERTFKVSGSGDLYIIDSGTYPFWLDLGGYQWTYFKSSSGTVLGGIAYLLASKYIEYFAGSSPIAGNATQLDPNQNVFQRMFYKEGSYQPYLIVELKRDETALPGVIQMFVRDDTGPDTTYKINRTTAAITKTWIESGVEKTESATPGTAEYVVMNEKAVWYVYVLIGSLDTPDYTAGNAWDMYTRYSPNQELFAVNVMNLLRGYGWNNLEMLETYYRDRLAQTRQQLP